ncbi:MAG: hypothetical protein ROR55_05235 [Devosia sp.]
MRAVDRSDIGYFEADGPLARRMQYCANVSWPRSGHHLLVAVLTALIGRRFGYCEFYTPRQVPNSPCCGLFPCAKLDLICMSKNHDFQFDSVVPPGMKLIVQIRDYLPSMISDFEVYVAVGNDDTVASFRRFAENRAHRYARFRHRWIVPDLPDRLIVTYDDLTQNLEATLRTVAAFAELGAIGDEHFARAIQPPPKRRGIPHHEGPLIRPARDPTAFRYYDEGFLKDIFALAYGPMPSDEEHPL